MNLHVQVQDPGGRPGGSALVDERDPEAVPGHDPLELAQDLISDRRRGGVSVVVVAVQPAAQVFAAAAASLRIWKIKIYLLRGRRRYVKKKRERDNAVS